MSESDLACRVNLGPLGQVSSVEYVEKWGDFSLLVERVRYGAELTAQERHLIADALEGKLKRRPHRPASREAFERSERVARAVTYLVVNRGWKQTAAINQTKNDFGVEESTVKKALAAFKKTGGHQNMVRIYGRHRVP